MKSPIEHVRVSTKGKDTLIKAKRRTGLTQWNELCRIAFCKSIVNPNPVKLGQDFGENAIDMEWKTFTGPNGDIYTALLLLCASKDGIDTSDKELLVNYFRNHLERGIASMNKIGRLEDLLVIPSNGNSN